MSLTKQRGPARIFILIFAALIVLWSFYRDYKSNTDVGLMEYRMITGHLNNSLEVIMIETKKQITILDQELREIFQNNDAELITRAEHLKLIKKYDDVQYLVNIHRVVKNENGQYKVSREQFNQFSFKTNTKFQIDNKVRDSISNIVQ